MNTTPDEPQAAPSSLSVGATLRAARAKTGKPLADVAAQLRIRQPFLLALEEGRHQDLPGGAYAIGFLRTYAEFLDLDGEEIVRRFRAEASGELNSRSELVFPSPVSEGRIPGGAVLFVGLLLAGLAYGGWYLLSSRDTSVAEMVPTLPEKLNSVLNRQAMVTAETPPPPTATADEPAKAEDTAAKPAEASSAAKDNEVVPPAEEDNGRADNTPAPASVPAAAPVVTPTKPVEPAKPTETVKPAEPVKPAEIVKPVEPAAPAKPVETAKPADASKPVETKLASPAPAVEPPKPTGDGTDSRVHLIAAADDCWIQVREMDGQLLMSRLLRKGDSYTVPNRPGLTLMVGNAGALDVVVDGKKAPSLGNAGQVRRDIRLDPDKLLGG